MTSRKTELKFQTHIADSYKKLGGYSKKWATEWTAGNPDLISSVEPFGLHLAEVKHEPDFVDEGKEIPNPLRLKQKQVARDYINAGANVIALLASGRVARNSKLYAYPPHFDTVAPWLPVAVPYVLGHGYDMVALLRMYKLQYGWQV